jgi:cellulose synthase/poly-beta-1,6-N-acetylglucosamine synthase-like glycosyltransferase
LHDISWSERPIQGRRGKFKKAGNLNFCLNRNILGEIILLLDSDSRISVKFLEKAIREFADSNLGFLQMRTQTLFSEKPSIWENIVGHFTNNIYNISFRVVCAFGDPSPLVGHNVFIRRKALQRCAEYDHTIMPSTNSNTSMRTDLGIVIQMISDNTTDPTQYTMKKSDEPYQFQFFSEHHVSEDFELSLRLQTAGYKGRYATYIDGFEEGVTLSALDEIGRLQKYAYGVNELTIHPIGQWCSRGILGSTFKAYLLSSNVSFAAKYNVLGYIGMYYALAFAPLAVTINYFAYHYSPVWNSIFTSAENILYSCILTFAILTPIAVLFIKKKLKLKFSILKEITCSIIFGLFFAGIGFHLLIAILAHFFGIDMSWTTTNKESPSRIEKLKQTWQGCRISFVWASAQLITIVVGWYYLNIRSWQGIIPMAISASAHLIVPFIGI